MLCDQAKDSITFLEKKNSEDQFQLKFRYTENLTFKKKIPGTPAKGN